MVSIAQRIRHFVPDIGKYVEVSFSVPVKVFTLLHSFPVFTGMISSSPLRGGFLISGVDVNVNINGSLVAGDPHAIMGARAIQDINANARTDPKVLFFISARSIIIDAHTFAGTECNPGRR